MPLNLVPDCEVLACRNYFLGGWIDNFAGYRLHFSFALGRNLTDPELHHILSCINGYGPHPAGTTWGELERSTEAFWRRPQ